MRRRENGEGSPGRDGVVRLQGKKKETLPLRGIVEDRGVRDEGKFYGIQSGRGG